MKKILGKLTYANVVATLALFLVLTGGAALAASQLGKNSVGSRQLKKNAVTTAKIKAHAVTGAKIKLSSLGKVPSAASADNANALQGNPASSFMQGGGRFFSARRELAIGDSNVTLMTLPGIGHVTTSCKMGKTYPQGDFEIFNESGSEMDQTLQYGEGVDGGTAANGKSVGFGGNEYVDAVTVQVSTHSTPSVVATLNLSFLKNENAGCHFFGQATLAGG